MRFLFLSIFILVINITEGKYLHHSIHVKIDIGSKSISGTDSIFIPKEIIPAGLKMEFYLNASINIASRNKKIKITPVESTGDTSKGELRITRYEVVLPKKDGRMILPLSFNGKILGELKEDPADVARGFSETSGIISEKGIYISGSTLWIPYFENLLFTFKLKTTTPKEWIVVSQGTRIENKMEGESRISVYDAPYPSDEVYLVSAKWSEYNLQSGNVLVQAVLRTPDEELAKKYLDVTSSYLDLYEKLIGPYPYSKFTLVENFWETGYGMPSFTLLGEKIIRFPFILHSSYPHELLHNYWGNSVYVDYEKGNWCEGLTSYMADHLIKEQQGQGAEYRRVVLQKYTDFVNDENDFPVVQFRSRSNSAEEAVGYGKVTMIFDMLRQKLGDDHFKKSLSAFYSMNKFRKASFDDIRIAFEKVTGRDLQSFFSQWTERKGAPSLALADISVTSSGKEYSLEFSISQNQKEDLFELEIPVAVYFDNDSVSLINVQQGDRKKLYKFQYASRPVRIEVDPQFNVFRRLDKSEVPLTLSQILGSKELIMILPSGSELIGEYLQLAERWKQTAEVQGNKITIMKDEELKELPVKSAWIIGYENKFADHSQILNEYSGMLSSEVIAQAGTLIKSGGLVYVFANPKDNSITNAFLGTVNKTQVAALARKISHYSKYSYLGFDGDKADNKLKGEFPAVNSKMNYNIPFDGKIIPVRAKLTARPALINSVR